MISGVTMVSAMEKVNINTASAEELTVLKNVGPKTAQAIIVYREAHQGFKTPEEIMEIKGVGEKTFQANKDMIVINDE
ncbi:ComEA family DNA-binding protein [Desulfocicer vacuolatum]|nr:helix-hairpin-helix domain-containing protein [Desulfocicer vacuolatum]